jgi:SAM-dependent methyltransferase
MIGLATHANKAAIARGMVVIEQGDAARLPHAAASFDRILATHTVYFRPDLERVAHELRRALKPRGRLVLGFGAAEHMRHEFPDAVYTLRLPAEICRTLERAGFADIRVETRTLGHRPMHWVIAA